MCLTSRFIQGGVLLSTTVFFGTNLSMAVRNRSFHAFQHSSIFELSDIAESRGTFIRCSRALSNFEVIHGSSYRFCFLKTNFDIEIDKVMIS